MMRLRRIARGPGGAATRAEVATILAAPLITTGMDVNFPSEDKVKGYNKQLYDTCIRQGRQWCCMPVFLALIAKGHALDPHCLMHRAALLAVRRQARRLPGHRAQLEDLRSSVQRTSLMPLSSSAL